MTAYENIITQKIYEIIAPYLGDLMAKGAIRSQCKKAGLDETKIQRHDLPVIAQNLAKAMNLFVGAENAQMLANKIKAL
ncbi:MAG: hypothetical protein GXX78_07435 [Bacteroidales bacterium]|nr:hypothetical protein [Bacteroidales bacterium]